MGRRRRPKLGAQKASETLGAEGIRNFGRSKLWAQKASETWGAAGALNFLFYYRRRRHHSPGGREKSRRKAGVSRVFPNCFKPSTVKPLLKKGDSTIISNYRPITILPFISKVFEHCLCTRLVNFAAMCNILSPNQFGFTKGKSTKDAI